jgi:predicted HTH transcriptional regulator
MIIPMSKKLNREQRNKRNRAIMEYRERNPEATLQELAEIFGLHSRAHVHYILQKEKSE